MQPPRGQLDTAATNEQARAELAEVFGPVLQAWRQGPECQAVANLKDRLPDIENLARQAQAQVQEAQGP